HPRTTVLLHLGHHPAGVGGDTGLLRRDGRRFVDEPSPDGDDLDRLTRLAGATAQHPVSARQVAEDWTTYWYTSTRATPQPLQTGSDAAVIPSHWVQKITRPGFEAISHTAEKGLYCQRCR